MGESADGIPDVEAWQLNPLLAVISSGDMELSLPTHALAFVAAGFGVAAVSEPLRKIPARDVIFRDLTPEDRTFVPLGAAWKPDGVTAAVP